ncbi:autotransporter domain-containing protein [Pseudomonas sp.]|uniref:autotransporter outer membrane beta-barrel domain-containing protein n=1 Tax=Pseudomonas sp. TaxID=306 RepID=UPI00257ED80F|nr:autotransporter domain-containing protein [Pseudomonas sp.]
MYSEQNPGQLTALAIAIISGLATTASPVAHAADTVISTAQTATRTWTTENFIVTTAGSITASNSNLETAGIEATGPALGAFDNSGSVSGNTEFEYASHGMRISGSAAISELNNSGSIAGNSKSINSGSTTALGSGSGISMIDSASIGKLNNTGTITGNGIGAGATIEFGQGKGISNGDNATIDELNNSGTIEGYGTQGYGIFNTVNATINTLNNTAAGTIIGSDNGNGTSFGILNNATINTLNNTGSIIGRDGGKGTSVGIFNSSNLGELNNSGLITGVKYSIENLGTLGTVTNSGTIAGEIRNVSANDLIINGGSGSTFGVLTGNAPGYGVEATNIGLITNTASNVVFGPGNQLLNNHVNVGSTHSVTNLGTLQVNNPINITGNYSQDAAASLLIGVGSNAVTSGNINTDTGYGRLLVSGNATVASGSTVGLKQLGSYGFAQGQRYAVIQANDAGTNYNADTLKYAVAGYDATGATVVDGTQQALVVTVGAEQVVTPPVVTPPVVVPPVVTPPVITPPAAPINRATTYNAISTTDGLYRYKGLNPDLMNTYNAVAAIDSSAAANRAGAQLNPSATLSAATQSSMYAITQVQNIAGTHLGHLRGESSGVSTGEGPANSGLWGQAFGGTAHRDESDDVAGYRARYNGLVIGADGQVNDKWRAGGLFSYTQTSTDNNDDNKGSSADVDAYGLFAYASYSADPWYLDLSAGAVQHQFDTKRRIDFNGVSDTATASHDGMQYTAAAQAGYPIDLGDSMGNATLTPIAGMSYSTLRQDNYTEKGGAGTALFVDADNLYSLKSDLGAKLERNFDTDYGRLTPYARLTWQHEYRDSGLQSAANFIGDTSGVTRFISAGPDAVEDTGVLSLGLTLLNSDNLQVSARYTGEVGDGFNANTGDVQLRWDF